MLGVDFTNAYVAWHCCISNSRNAHVPCRYVFRVLLHVTISFMSNVRNGHAVVSMLGVPTNNVELTPYSNLILRTQQDNIK